MEYSVKGLAKLAGVSVRTLHFYDQIGLLKARRDGANGYRSYGADELLRLQQIMFFRELDFKLADIQRIMNQPGFDIEAALRMHRKLLEGKIARLQGLVTTLNKTLLSLKGEIPMKDEEYYGNFSREQQEKYEQEIRQKYGSTALDESKRRMKGWAKADFDRVMADGTRIFTAIRDNMPKGHASPEVQAQVAELHQWLNNFYDCSLEMLEGMSHMYSEHPDFVKMWQTTYHADMPDFLARAIQYYVNIKFQKSNLKD